VGRIIVSSQGMVVVHVGGENGTLKQSFVVHRELLMLNSSFFCSLLAEKVKVQVEENEQLRVKSEETEVPGLGDRVVTRRKARTEEDLPLEEQRKQLESDADRMIGIRWTEIGQEKEQPKDGGGSTCSSSLSSLSGQFDDVVQSALFPDLVSKPNSATQPQPSPINHPSTPGTTAVPPITKLHVAGINPIHFSAFISYIYTQHISPSLSTLLLPRPHLFPTLYLLASQLGSPNFMNYVLTQHIQTKDTSWPSPEQVQYIYSATAAYHPLSVDIPGECGTMAGMDNEGPRILKRFTAACIAANCPFEKYTEGETIFVEWDNMLKDCAGLGRDVVMAQAKWIEKKPWDEGYRKEWMAEERGLEERWEEIFGNGEL
jgi:hypothetical protein